MTVPCCHCGEDLDPKSRFTFREVIGWDQVGRTAVAARQTTGRYACDRCMAQLKAKLTVGQGAML